MSEHTFSEERDGMKVDWQVPVEMPDGAVLRADVYRPVTEGRYPVILSHGVYAKGLAFNGPIYKMQWDKLVAKDPSVLEGSTNRYQAWEVTDPERWVPDGYVVVRVDSRGAGWSEGFLDPRSPQEFEDICSSIEWAGTRAWSSGKVGVLGISYYAVMGWAAAARKAPHLAALIAWEGFNDQYRDAFYHGGILSEFTKRWQPTQINPIQYGQGERAPENPNTGQSVAGPETLPEEVLGERRRDYFGTIKSHPLYDDWHQARAIDVSAVEVPLLSAANWGGQGIHPRGNFNGFIQASSEQKWLEAHGDTHWTHFYSAYGRDLQKRFFDHFLKGLDNGFDRTPRVQLNIRRPGEQFEWRGEDEWPLARTEWTPMYLGPELTLGPAGDSAALEYSGLGDGLLFVTAPFDVETEITGPMAAKLYISSSTEDADLFLIVRLFDPEGREVTFEGSTDPNTPIANGWLRASHRALDPERSQPWQPFHPHDRREPLTPGEIHELVVEIVPSCIAVPPGYRLGLWVRGKDYEYGGSLDDYGQTFYYATRGTGGMTHADPDDRPEELFGGTVTVHVGPDHPSHLLLPVIPPK
ncbi:MAG: CocE/NonD family hydrolase [Acidimicrobiia bacterium]|nr:CocE/NonD family hydrolase [Acidimicrobiia bacterium]MDH4307209.1 CocE/NonD family hydrolase [Acidimicrobiia bacterium]MDH5293037.1 CocE/NonD family hydrolase [Acidimicrobiia bacterium]